MVEDIFNAFFKKNKNYQTYSVFKNVFNKYLFTSKVIGGYGLDRKFMYIFGLVKLYDKKQSYFQTKLSYDAIPLTADQLQNIDYVKYKYSHIHYVPLGIILHLAKVKLKFIYYFIKAVPIEVTPRSRKGTSFFEYIFTSNDTVREDFTRLIDDDSGVYLDILYLDDKKYMNNFIYQHLRQEYIEHINNRAMIEQISDEHNVRFVASFPVDTKVGKWTSNSMKMLLDDTFFLCPQFPDQIKNYTQMILKRFTLKVLCILSLRLRKITRLTMIKILDLCYSIAEEIILANTKGMHYLI